MCNHLLCSTGFTNARESSRINMHNSEAQSKETQRSQAIITFGTVNKPPHETYRRVPARVRTTFSLKCGQETTLHSCCHKHNQKLRGFALAAGAGNTKFVEQFAVYKWVDDGLVKVSVYS